MTTSDAIILAFLLPTGIAAIISIGKNFIWTMKAESKKDKLIARSKSMDFKLNPSMKAQAVRNK